MYHGENKLPYDEMMMISVFVLDQQAEFVFHIARLMKQMSTGRHVTPLRHIIKTLSHKSLVSFLNDVCLAEKQQIPIL